MINPGRPFWLLPLGLGSILAAAYLGWLVLGSSLPLVGVIKWTEEIESFEESRQGVIEGMREEGYQDGLNIRLQVINARADRTLAAEAGQKFQRQGARLLITLGTIPTLIALEVTQIPVVYCTVATPELTGLGRSGAEPQSIRFTGTSMEVPAAEQLHFLLLTLPGLKRLGVLNCVVTPQGVATAQSVQVAAQVRGLTVVREEVTDDRSELLEQAMGDLLRQKIQALLIPTDPVLNTPKNLGLICQMAHRARIPVMVSSPGLVKNGALLAYHADFAEIGRQAGRQAARLLAGAQPHTVGPEAPMSKQLTLNLRAAQDLNLPLSRKLLSRVDNLFQ
jgi:putative ABC transport system substrate-binding protein